MERGETSALSAFLVQSARSLSAAVTTALALLDFEAIYICSRMPGDILTSLGDRMKVDPIGTGRFDDELAARNAAPLIHIRHIPNHAQLACRMALDDFLATADPAISKG